MKTARTVLLVEDEPEQREAMAFALRRRGYDVVTAGDAAGAEEVLVRDLPDLLVTDMMLPGRSGYQVLRLAAEVSNGRLPAIMMSANTAPAHRDYALAAGADRFLAKPFSLADLARAAEALCPPPPPTTAPHPVPLMTAAGS
ncbi:MAG: response regulator [Gemmataceae bacterium]|nr:response regulator [Gemmataceae bacterium]